MDKSDESAEILGCVAADDKNSECPSLGRRGRRGRKRRSTGAIYLLVALFGSASWLSVNSVWLEMPLMVARLPEGWSLPSFLAVVVQLGCVGPLAYWLLKRRAPAHRPAPIILGLLIFACLSTVLLVAFWSATLTLPRLSIFSMTIGGAPFSAALFAVFFCLALVNCTSNVLFLPYMVAFKPHYMTAYFVGMGLSGLFPSVVSLLQGAGRVDCVPSGAVNDSGLVPSAVAARFSIELYNVVMFAWLCLATVSFATLNWAPFANADHHRDRTVQNFLTDPAFNVEETEPMKTNGVAERIGLHFTTLGAFVISTQLVHASSSQVEEEPITVEEPSTSAHTLSTNGYVSLLLVTGLACALMNGIIPSVQSFACLPYGQLTYHLALTLGNVANPAACFVPMLIANRSPALIGLLSLPALGFAGYIVLLAALSPSPPLLGGGGGATLAVLASVGAHGLLAYVRTAAAGVLREGLADSERRLFWCGAFTQAGSFVGALLIFPLVNVFHLFKSAPYC